MIYAEVWAQNTAFKQFTIEGNQPCHTVLELFKRQYGILLAYNPKLDHTLGSSRRIEANTVDSLFVKLCDVMQLEYTQSEGTHSFLVRSQPQDIQNAKYLIHHINVKNSLDGSPVPYAIVYDASKKYYGYTDEAGDCFIKIPKNVDVASFFTHALGHKDEKIERTSNGFNEVKLTYDPLMATPVTIQNLKKALSMANKNAAITVHADGLERLGQTSIFHRDGVRLMQLLPGVSAINDTKSGLRIRGANEEATLMLLDEMPIYKADHFYGIFSAINGLYIRKMELYKNNIPVTYGGRTSGLLRMTSHPQPDSTELQLDFQLLQSGALLRLPLGHHHSIALAGRKSYFNLAKSNYFEVANRENTTLNELLNGGSTVTARPKFDFYDYHTKYAFDNGKHALNINLFRSEDALKNTYTSTFSNPSGVEKINDSFAQSQKWSNKAQSINYSLRKSNFDVHATFFHTAYTNNSTTTGALLRKFDNNSFFDSLKIFSANTIEDYGIRGTVDLRGSFPLTLGVEGIKHDNTLELTNDSGNPLLNTARAGSELSVFGKSQISTKKIGDFFPALRLTAVPYINEFVLLPQLQWRKNLSDKALLKASIGRQMQVIRAIDHESVLGTTQSYFTMSNDFNIPLGLGYNSMIGAWFSSGNFNFDIEGYFRYLDGAILHASQKPELRKPGSPPAKDQFQIFQGEQKTLGVDIILAYDTKHFFSLLSYTLSASENRFDRLFDDQYFPAAEDTRHQIKWANTLKIGNADLSLTYIGASGRPYLDFSNFRLPRNRSEIDMDDFTQHLPDYHRLDLSAFYHIKIFHQSAKIGVSVFNVTDRINVKYKQFVHEIDLPNMPSVSAILGTDVAQLNRTWNVSLLLTIK